MRREQLIEAHECRIERGERLRGSVARRPQRSAFRPSVCVLPRSESRRAGAWRSRDPRDAFRSAARRGCAVSPMRCVVVSTSSGGDPPRSPPHLRSSSGSRWSTECNARASETRARAGALRRVDEVEREDLDSGEPRHHELRAQVGRNDEMNGVAFGGGEPGLFQIPHAERAGDLHEPPIRSDADVRDAAHGDAAKRTGAPTSSPCTDSSKYVL